MELVTALLLALQTVQPPTLTITGPASPGWRALAGSPPSLIAAPRFDLSREALAPETHWVRGGVIGALILGTLTAALAIELNEHSEGERRSNLGSGVRGLVVGGALGFGIGSMIGGAFAK